MARVTRQALREADLTFTWKLFLRTFTIILALIAIGLIAWAETHIVVPVLEAQDGQATEGYYTYGPAYDDEGYDNWLIPWEHIPLGLSIIWNIANIGVWFTPSRSGRGMHPGANVGCDLILWLILLVTGIFASFAAFEYTNSWSFDNGYDDYGYGGDTYSNGTRVDSNQCAPFLNCDAAADYHNGLLHKGVVIAVAVAFTFLIMLFHFALFISACRYTNARRNSKSGKYARAMTEEATALATKMVRDMGFQPPPQWPAQPYPQQQWVPHGQQQQMNGAPAMHPYSMQPKSEADPAERELQERLHREAMEPQQQLGKGKARADDPEMGFEHSPVSVDYGSSSQHPPSISVDGPAGTRNGDGIVR